MPVLISFLVGSFFGSALGSSTKVFLPPMIDRYPAPHDNFAWYKVIATHQVLRLDSAAEAWGLAHYGL